MDTTRDYCTKSETERRVQYDITYIWNLKYDTNQLIYEAKIESWTKKTNSIQFSSVTQLCSTLCDPMDCITPGLPVHHQLLKLIQTHVHQVDDAIQSSYPLSSPSPPALNRSQHQGLLQ